MMKIHIRHAHDSTTSSRLHNHHPQHRLLSQVYQREPQNSQISNGTILTRDLLSYTIVESVAYFVEHFTCSCKRQNFRVLRSSHALLMLTIKGLDLIHSTQV